MPARWWRGLRLTRFAGIGYTNSALSQANLAGG